MNASLLAGLRYNSDTDKFTIWDNLNDGGETYAHAVITNDKRSNSPIVIRHQWGSSSNKTVSKPSGWQSGDKIIMQICSIGAADFCSGPKTAYI
ncbi:hypothetical protein SAMN05421684_6769 [Asanoa ishikariensis]|uniref:Uncharacterized protein n=2 Tax=Asanoa ishikariensis TaxID=137265 RepID=A0A1H3U8J7_9ACTN|nr:hypothetical protein SAMN05421684_6769 [Asanoa ishikariensis]